MYMTPNRVGLIIIAHLGLVLVFYHYHLDIELFAVVCMPVKCFSLFFILIFHSH